MTNVYFGHIASLVTATSFYWGDWNGTLHGLLEYTTGMEHWTTGIDNWNGTLECKLS